MNTPVQTPDSAGRCHAKTRYHIILGCTCAVAAALVIGSIMLMHQHHVANLEQQRLSLLQSSRCQQFIADLQALQTQTAADINSLGNACATAFTATRSDQIHLDSLIAMANAVKQDLVTYQQLYPRITPLINLFTPEQVTTIRQLRDQFTAYSSLSTRFDNTLSSIDDTYNRLAQNENQAQTVTKRETKVTKTKTAPAVSRPSQVYTAPAYYSAPYNDNSIPFSFSLGIFSWGGGGHHHH